MKKYTAIVFGIIVLSTFSFANKTIKVNLSSQTLTAFENGEIFLSGRISSGMPGRDTPVGTWKITQKKRHHVSNLWPKPKGGAKMPYMMRLGSSAIALHAGRLPGRPASHGCIRVGNSTAKKLFKWANSGTKVEVFGNAGNYTPRAKYSRKKSYSKKKYSKKKYAKEKKKKRNKRYTREELQMQRYRAQGYFTW